MRWILLAALALLPGCRGRQAEAKVPQVATAPPGSAAGDVPLPAPDEVPAFLRGGARTVAAQAPLPAAPPVVEPAKDPMAGVTVSDGEGGDSYAFVEDGEDPDAAGAQAPAEPAEPAEAKPADDPCADIHEAIQVRTDFLNRASSERDRFGFLNGSGASALRLLDGLRRCKAHPEDPDCQPQPIEVDISQLEKQAAAVERDPDELVSDGTHDEAILQDPVLVDLDRRLRVCQRAQVAQPLLERPKPH